MRQVVRFVCDECQREHHSPEFAKNCEERDRENRKARAEAQAEEKKWQARLVRSASMGMDIHGKTTCVRMNWTLWSAMLRILKDNGFTGNLPSGNDGETVDKETAREVGKAVLRWWHAKDESACEQPQLESWESTILAYALLLCVDDGEAEHS